MHWYYPRGQTPHVTIYEAVGGDDAFLRVARAFHARALADPELNHPFSHPGHPQHVERLAAYWAETLGGPATYSAEMSDQTGMLRIHANNGMGEEYERRFLACFMAALDDADISDDATLRDALRDYMTWSLADVLQYSRRDAVVPEKMPMPRWSWDGYAGDGAT
jgi:hemoglobin